MCTLVSVYISVYKHSSRSILNNCVHGGGVGMYNIPITVIYDAVTAGK